MNLKKISFGFAIATTVVAGSLVTLAPAKASTLLPSLSVGDVLIFDGTASFNETTGTITFGNMRIDSGTSSSLGNVNDSLSFSTLTLNNIGTNKWEFNSTSTTFIAGLNGGNRTFDLGSITLEKATVGSATIFGGTILGQFVPPGVLGSGEYSTQGRFSLGGTSISGDITVVPTPALLPGLIGLGIAALRKKKQEEVA